MCHIGAGSALFTRDDIGILVTHADPDGSTYRERVSICESPRGRRHRRSTTSHRSSSSLARSWVMFGTENNEQKTHSDPSTPRASTPREEFIPTFDQSYGTKYLVGNCVLNTVGNSVRSRITTAPPCCRLPPCRRSPSTCRLVPRFVVSRRATDDGVLAVLAHSSKCS